MVRDARLLPRGLIAPLSQAALGTLRNLHEGNPVAVATEYKSRLLDLGLIEEGGDGAVTVTALGRQRLVSDR